MPYSFCVPALSLEEALKDLQSYDFLLKRQYIQTLLVQKQDC